MFVCVYLENFFFHNTLTLRLSVSSVKHKQNVSSTTKPRAIVYVGFELLWPFIIVKVHLITKYFLFMLELQANLINFESHNLKKILSKIYVDMASQ